MWRKRSRSRFTPADRRRALSLRVFVNPEVRAEETAEGLRLTYPVRPRPIWRKLLCRGGRDDAVFLRKLQLDELGTWVWRQLADRPSVAELRDRFAGRYQVPQREAETAVTAFLRELGRRGLIGLG